MNNEQNFVISEKTGKKYYPTIGLEIHAELNTNTKMFCACRNEPFADGVNENICEVCTAQPGALPYVNKKAIEHVLRVGMAMGGDLADFSEFDRKNYFYPDMPKAYQISQFKYPLISNGKLNGVELERIHLEEDTATSSHKENYSLVNFNRAGVPLMELVSMPMVTSAEQASEFGKELQLLLRTLGAGNANLEKGEMRVEANISVSEVGNWEMLGRDFKKLGVKTELKNLGSFKVVRDATNYEIKRQIESIESGEGVVQSTRGWNDNKQETFFQRTKENADDYRYFPDPDIPKYKLSEIEEFNHETLKKSLPELPWEKRERYAENFKIKSEDIEFYLQNPEFGAIFDEATDILGSGSDEKCFKLLSNYISSDLIGFEKSEDVAGELKNISGKNLADLVNLISNGDLSSRGAKDTLEILYKNGGEAKEVAEKNNLIQKSDEGELKKVVEKIVSDNPEIVEKYREGEEKLLQFFVGQGMKATQGSANPGLLAKLFKESL